jgi:amidophosphoribosyltransferase
MRIASPPTAHSCFYGVDTTERSKLLAARMDVEAMRQFIQADSLAFITIEGLYRALGEERNAGAPQRCDACFTGAYPTVLTDYPVGSSDLEQEVATRRHMASNAVR